jgi:archaemetzincin
MSATNNIVQLLAVGNVNRMLLEELQERLPRYLGIPCEILPLTLDPESCFHIERQQYHSSELLQKMRGVAEGKWRVLGITPVDLYIPILKYVFGEAQVGGRCAVVSYFRLRQEFYGLDQDDGLLVERLLKESIHELGHTLELRHCQDYRCVMASSHAVEWIDLREFELCPACKAQAEYAMRESRLRLA